jgi:hypothetical protein
LEISCFSISLALLRRVRSTSPIKEFCSKMKTTALKAISVMPERIV